MNEYTKEKVLVAIKLVILLFSVGLVIIGQKNIGPKGLGIQILGLAIMIALLWDYNRKHK